MNKTKYLCINLTMNACDIYEEKYNTLVKEIKDLNKWSIISCPYREIQSC